MLIRPEWLEIVSQDNSPIHGVVTAKQFKGAYSVYDIVLGNQQANHEPYQQIVSVYAQDDSIRLGDSVGVRVLPKTDNAKTHNV